MPVLYQFMIICCLNDAVPRAVFLDTDSLVEPDDWVRVTGVVDTLHLEGAVYPCLKDVLVQGAEVQGSPYLYP